MRRRTLWTALLALLLGALLIAVLLYRGCRIENPNAPLAPDAPKAPEWPSQPPTPPGKEDPPTEPVRQPAEPVDEPAEPVDEPTVPVQEPSEDPPQQPAYHWPPDFKLPLEITIDNVPEMPAALLGPSAPINEEEP